MSTVALNKIVAVEKSTKSDTNSKISALYKTVQKPAMFNGLNRTYQPVDDEGTQYPPEGQRVQLRVDEVVSDFQDAMVRLFDVIATKDWGNCGATADVEVDGEVILRDVPVTYLLFLEKQLTDIKTFVSKLPTLDPAEEWEWNDQKELFTTAPVKTHRTQKVPRVVVKYEATPDHPAQTEMFTEDIVVGYWTNIKFSGAVPQTRIRDLLSRVTVLRDAVKRAREQANSTEVSQITTGRKVMEWLFK